MKLIWKLLRHHISPSQLGGFFLANLFGMTIVLVGIQFYTDVLPLFTGGDSFIRNDFLVVSKKVSTIGSFVGRDNTFSAEETAEIEEQPFVKGVGAFVPSQFRVTAGVSMAGTGIHVSTDMFFEAVPAAYVDVAVKEWGYTPGTEEIPIVIPRNYLNLYNFGFAQSRNMPKISEGLMSMIQLDVLVRGNGKSDHFTGHIVGFSDRLNTILVPEEFITWANGEYAAGKESRPVRLIVEVGNPADERIAKFFRQKGYDIEDGKLDAGKTTWFLRLLVGIVMTVGVLITLLSFYILMLSICLLLEKNTVKIENLLLMGYSPAKVALPYQLLTVGLNGGVLLVSVGLMWLVRGLYMGVLHTLAPQMEEGSVLVTLLVGVLLCVAVSLLNAVAVRKKIKSAV